MLLPSPESAIIGLGYDRSPHLLPFDHRHSYVIGMFKFKSPLTTDEDDAVVDTKRAIYEGFRQALGRGAPMFHAGILVQSWN